MGIPKINLLYYKHILDSVLFDFFQETNEFFTKQDDVYVFSAGISRLRLTEYFTKKIVSTIKKHVVSYSKKDPNYYFIIGACYPKDNFLLKYRHQGYFPEKLSRLIFSDNYAKYLLREKDIHIDMKFITDIFLDVFIKFFSSKSAVLKEFGASYQNVVFIMHNRLDCYLMFKVLKYVFGAKNCVNVYAEKLSNEPKCIIAVNELIDKYITNKKEINKSKDFVNIVNEIRRYSSECINTIYDAK